MILEVIKSNEQYILKNPPDFKMDNFFIIIENKDIFEYNPGNKNISKPDLAYQKLKELAIMYPEDNLIQNMFKYYKPHIEIQHRTDDEVYHDYLMERYGK